MKIQNKPLAHKAVIFGVQSVLICGVFAAPALADDTDSDLYLLTHPTSTLEFGTLYSSQQSARFGQYNGLNKEGFYGLGNFDIRGGAGYDSTGSALRWQLDGLNIGTTSRAFDGKLTDQGKWSIRLGYDELQHNITDTFKTPFQGKTDGNEFNLPEDFGSISAASGTDGTRKLSAPQLSAFHTQKEYATRRNAPFSASYIFSPEFSAQIDYNHLEQSGAKLIGTGSQGGIALFGGSAPSTGRAEAINLLMNPTSYSTDNLNAALHWRGENAHLTGGYYGSIFHDNYNSLNWQSPMSSAKPTAPSTCTGDGCYVNNSMSTAPSNSLHQANLSGGYDFSSTTKLAGGFSYGYNMQDSSYAPTSVMQASGTALQMMQAGGLPVSSLNGRVATTHGDLKLTDQTIKDLTLTAGFKFNERDNQTRSETYRYYNLAGLDLAKNGYTGVNTPYSNRKTQYEAAGDYRISKGQNLRLGYERQNIERWCDSVVGAAQCIASPASDEDKVGLTYRLKALEDVNFNAGYSFAKRNASFDHNFLANAGNYATKTAVSGSALNAGDYLGYVAYPYANRTQNMVKTGVNWQATEKLDLGLNGRYTYDDYDATLGVQNGRSAGVNLDATYTFAEHSSFSAYWSWQNGKRNLRSGTTKNGTKDFTPSQILAPKNIWSNQLEDNSNAFGVAARNNGFLDGKLELIGDVSYSIDTSGYSTQTPYLPVATCASSTSLTCGSLPDIKNEVLSLKLTGNYQLHKNGKLSLAYMYQKLNSNDYFYNAQQFGYTPNSMLPNGLQPQDYTMNVVAMSYILSF